MCLISFLSLIYLKVISVYHYIQYIHTPVDMALYKGDNSCVYFSCLKRFDIHFNFNIYI